ncbi:MAG: acetaldehyde dehydrogenase (acetylating) [Fibrobacter sp.]|jgi:acetaldehyde dehydrogenase (acetylating)|nr:acetaldehyde dehydrogenase (acetylating) [Fibrobacter sp.]
MNRRKNLAANVKGSHLKKTRVAILGSGNIGTDLLVKIQRSPLLECSCFIGRRCDSPGIKKAISMGVKISDKGIEAIKSDPSICDIVFDATSAQDHQIHAPVLKSMNKFVIDMTPSHVGKMCVPAVNLKDCLQYSNVNMVTCGGQASIPISYAIAKIHQDIEYIEVVSSIASRSAGPATRANLDEYIHTTEEGNAWFSKSKKVKAILNLNPAQPCIDMQTTVFAKIKYPDMAAITDEVEKMVKVIQEYVPGYQLIISPTLENGRIITMVKVQGLGDFLPRYAGNLDIINCAAIAMAEEYARSITELEKR